MARNDPLSWGTVNGVKIAYAQTLASAHAHSKIEWMLDPFTDGQIKSPDVKLHLHKDPTKNQASECCVFLYLTMMP